MASLTVSGARERQISEAQGFLQETRGKRTVRYDILPEVESFTLQDQEPATLFEIYGEAYRKYLQHSLITEKFRNACQIAKEKVPGLDHPNIACDLAIYRIGSSDCDELCVALWLKAFAKGKPAFRVYATSDIENYNHVFVIYGVNNKELIRKHEQLGPDFFLLMKSLTKGIIVDPYLNLVCPVKQFESSKLADYCRACNITQYHDSVAHPPVGSVEEAESLTAGLYEEAGRIVNVARTLLNASENTNQRIADLQAALEKIPKAEKKEDGKASS